MDVSTPRTTTLPQALFGAENLPTIPEIAFEVLRLCRDDKATLDDLSELLARDPVLAAPLLSFANSSLYGMNTEVATLRRATLVFGMKTVQVVSLAFALAASLRRFGSVLDQDLFWRRAITRAVAGRALAKAAGTLTEDEAFLCGLASELGQVVMAECLREPYREVLDRAVSRWPTVELEQEVLGFHSAHVGRALFDHWDFPATLGQALEAQHAPRDLPAGTSPMVVKTAYVLRVANHVTELLTGDSPALALKHLEEEGERAFGLSPRALERLVVDLDEVLREAAEMLSFDWPAGPSPGELLSEARNEYIQRDLGTPSADDGPARVEVPRSITHDEHLKERLTGLANRAGLERLLDHECEENLSGRSDRGIGVLSLRLDQYLDFECPDLVRHVGASLNRLTRAMDLCAYLGDGEYAIVMSDGTPHGLRTMAERLRRGVMARPVEVAGRETVPTLTIGGLYGGPVQSLEDGRKLLDAARAYLRQASLEGSNHSLIHEGRYRP